MSDLPSNSDAAASTMAGLYKDEMARETEFRQITDRTTENPVGYDKQKLWAACYKQWTTEWQLSLIHI